MRVEQGSLRPPRPRSLRVAVPVALLLSLRVQGSPRPAAEAGAAGSGGRGERRVHPGGSARLRGPGGRAGPRALPALVAASGLRGGAGRAGSAGRLLDRGGGASRRPLAGARPERERDPRTPEPAGAPARTPHRGRGGLRDLPAAHAGGLSDRRRGSASSRVRASRSGSRARGDPSSVRSRWWSCGRRLRSRSARSRCPTPAGLPDSAAPSGTTGCAPRSGGRTPRSATGRRRAGDPLVLRVELEGSGNLRAAGTPRLPDSGEVRRAFRFFDPDSTSETGLREAGSGLAFGGRQVWEFPMVPEAGGVRNLAGVTLDVFNPRTGAYERLASEPLRIRVEGAAATAPGSEGTGGGGAVRGGHPLPEAGRAGDGRPRWSLAAGAAVRAEPGPAVPVEPGAPRPPAAARLAGSESRRVPPPRRGAGRSTGALARGRNRTRGSRPRG